MVASHLVSIRLLGLPSDRLPNNRCTLPDIHYLFHAKHTLLKVECHDVSLYDWSIHYLLALYFFFSSPQERYLQSEVPIRDVNHPEFIGFFTRNSLYLKYSLMRSFRAHYLRDKVFSQSFRPFWDLFGGFWTSFHYSEGGSDILLCTNPRIQSALSFRVPSSPSNTAFRYHSLRRCFPTTLNSNPKSPKKRKRTAHKGIKWAASRIKMLRLYSKS